jgi:hypothetical protein
MNGWRQKLVGCARETHVMYYVSSCVRAETLEALEAGTNHCTTSVEEKRRLDCGTC